RAQRASSRARSGCWSIPAGRGRHSTRRRSQLVFEPIQEQALRWQELAARRIQIEPGGAIDLRKPLHLARARRPFDLERIARQSSDIGVPGCRPRVDNLAPVMEQLATRSWLGVWRQRTQSIHPYESY